MKLIIDIPDNELKVPLKNIHLLINNGIVGEVCIKKYDKDEPYFMDLNYTSLEDMGEVSDGYHTFNQLYHQRAVLFATIVNQNKDRSWKSFKHSDGNYCFDSNGEWFVVGIDTPQGSYTYHYAKEYWDMFDCEELECGKEWDGHTEEDVTRLLSLEQEPCTDAISRKDALFAVRVGILSTATVYGRSEEGMATRREIEGALRALPPVKPEQKMGHWITYDVHGHKACKCSECNNDVGYPCTDKYCKYCGVKMEEVEE